MSTRQQQIAELARNAKGPLTSIYRHLDHEWLKEAYRRLRRNGAPGVDGQTVAEYGQSLESNLEDLRNRILSGRYKAPPVKRVHIPKGDGRETRPIGIPTVEDKLVQRAVCMLLEPIYEGEFYNFSYGFRPGRGAHQALDAVWREIMDNQIEWIVDVDIRKFFDTLDHGHLRAILDKRVRDGVIRRLIDKWLASGVLEEGEVNYPEEGTPQGGVISPMLGNIFLHEVLDKWFVEEVEPRLKGRAFIVRYADDVVMGFELKEDAERVMEVMPKRLGRFGLELNVEKTRMIRFKRPGSKGGGDNSEEENGTFDFLGFTLYWGRSLRGNWVVKKKTARNRLCRAIKAVGDWIRQHRHESLKTQHQSLAEKVRGHYAYYGITGNARSLQRFRESVRKLWFKWLNHRDRRRNSLTWERFTQLTSCYELPVVRIVHSIYRAKPAFGGTGCVSCARPDLWGSGLA